MTGMNGFIFFSGRGLSTVCGDCTIVSASSCGAVKGMLLWVFQKWNWGSLEIYLGSVGCDTVMSGIGSSTLIISALCSPLEVKNDFRVAMRTMVSIKKMMGMTRCGVCKEWTRSSAF